MQIEITLPQVATSMDEEALNTKLAALNLEKPIQYRYSIQKSFGVETLVLIVTIKVVDRITTRLTDGAIDKATDAVWGRIKTVGHEVAEHTFEGRKPQVELHIEGSDREVRLTNIGVAAMLYLGNARAAVDASQGSVELFYYEKSHQYLTAEEIWLHANPVNVQISGPLLPKDPTV